MMKKVSIIIPTYKRPQTLKRALKSVISQSYTDIEVLVIDDGASEADQSVMDVITGLNDERIIYYPNLRKKGANGARNTGIIKSNGYYLSFLDDDDEFMPGKIEESLLILEKTDFACAVSRFYYLHDSKWYESKRITEEINLRNYLLGRLAFGSGSNNLIEREVFNQIGLWNEDLQRNQDVELLIRILDKYKVTQVDKPLLKVYGHTSQNADEMVITKDKFFNLIMPYIKKLAPQDQKLFFALQYREIALLYGLQNEKTKMIKFLLKSIHHKILNPKKYVRFVLLTIDSCLKIKSDYIWQRIKYRVELGKSL